VVAEFREPKYRLGSLTEKQKGQPLLRPPLAVPPLFVRKRWLIFFPSD